MNSGKKILRQDNNKKGKKGKPAKKGQAVRRSGARTVFEAIIVVLVLVVIVVAYDQLQPRLILNIGDQKLYLKDMTYDIFDAEQQGDSMDSLYRQLLGSGYWDADVSDGMTGRQLTKAEIIDNVVEREVLYRKATNEGYSLTDDERNEIQESVDEIRNNLSFRQKMMGGMGQNAIRGILERKKIAENYKRAMKDGFEFDRDAIIAEISREDYRQYDVEYYHASFVATNEAGEEVPLNDEDKAGLRQEMEALYANAKDAEDFASLIAEEEKEESVLQFSKESFKETDEFPFNDELRADVKKMANGEMTEVLENEDGIYLIKMIENNSDESYQNAVDEAIASEEDRLFTEAFEEILTQEEFALNLNSKEWDKIEIGSFAR